MHIYSNPVNLRTLRRLCIGH